MRLLDSTCCIAQYITRERSGWRLLTRVRVDLSRLAFALSGLAQPPPPRQPPPGQQQQQQQQYGAYVPPTRPGERAGPPNQLVPRQYAGYGTGPPPPPLQEPPPVSQRQDAPPSAAAFARGPPPSNGISRMGATPPPPMTAPPQAAGGAGVGGNTAGRGAQFYAVGGGGVARTPTPLQVSRSVVSSRSVFFLLPLGVSCEVMPSGEYEEMEVLERFVILFVSRRLCRARNIDWCRPRVHPS